jgi:hypothetical protein
MDVVDMIRKVKTRAILQDGEPVIKDIPQVDVVIRSIRRAK